MNADRLAQIAAARAVVHEREHRAAMAMDKARFAAVTSGALACIDLLSLASRLDREAGDDPAGKAMRAVAARLRHEAERSIR